MGRFFRKLSKHKGGRYPKPEGFVGSGESNPESEHKQFYRCLGCNKEFSENPYWCPDCGGSEIDASGPKRWIKAESELKENWRWAEDLGPHNNFGLSEEQVNKARVLWSRHKKAQGKYEAKKREHGGVEDPNSRRWATRTYNQFSDYCNELGLGSGGEEYDSEGRCIGCGLNASDFSRFTDWLDESSN